MQPLFQQIPFKQPDFIHRILTGDVSSNLCVEVLRAGASTFAGDCEAILKDQNTESEQLEWDKIRIRVERFLTSFVSFVYQCPASAVVCSKIMFAADGGHPLVYYSRHTAGI